MNILYDFSKWIFDNFDLMGDGTRFNIDCSDDLVDVFLKEINSNNYYILIQDRDCYWYIIPYDKEDEWYDWLNLDEESEEAWTVPDYAILVNGSQTSVRFQNYEIIY